MPCIIIMLSENKVWRLLLFTSHSGSLQSLQIKPGLSHRRLERDAMTAPVLGRQVRSCVACQRARTVFAGASFNLVRCSAPMSWLAYRRCRWCIIQRCCHTICSVLLVVNGKQGNRSLHENWYGMSTRMTTQSQRYDTARDTYHDTCIHQRFTALLWLVQ